VNLLGDTSDCATPGVSAGYTPLMRNRQNIVTMTAVAAGVLTLAAGCGWPTGPNPIRPGGSTTSTGVGSCAATSLAPQVRDDQGTAGTQRFVVTLTNRGSSTCALVGYPVLVLRDANGRLLPPAQPTGQSLTVRLSAGHSATATMTVTPAACPTVPLASTAAVSPPGSSYSTNLSVRIPVCRPTISPVVS
jgi:hypothetical protein